MKRSRRRADRIGHMRGVMRLKAAVVGNDETLRHAMAKLRGVTTFLEKALV